MSDTLAVLLTCHNRKEKTLSCLKRVFKNQIPKNLKKIDVYLVDDGSTDGTSRAINEHYPSVNIIQGNGSLFWNQGMRLAWDTAVENQSYDFYLWLNDDVLLENYALIELFECYFDILNKRDESGIIVGSFNDTKLCTEFSYGGRTDVGAVIPNGKIQKCKYINGNAVLVPCEIYKILGNLSLEYTHAMGDFDYGLRAIQAGFNNYTTSKFIGVCPKNLKLQWSSPNIPLKKRLELFNSPTGLNYQEYIIFIKKFWRKKWIIFAIKAHVKLLFPSFYEKLK